MNLTIESIFKQDETAQFCRETATGSLISQKCRALLLYAAGGCALYGFTMGLGHSPAQALSSAVKVFLLFALTLAICLPTLHFIGLLFGSRIKLQQTLTVLLGGVSLTGILLGAFAPISLFFLLSSASYEFLLLLHVAIFACCGVAGLLSIKRNMDTITQLVVDDDNRKIGFDDSGQSTTLLNIWFLLYMFIGSQMSYLLSPFVGNNTDFLLFASHKGDFFSYVFQTIAKFFE
jgi:hypothetical protein